MLRLIYILLVIFSCSLIALMSSEIFFVVTNSNRPDFFDDGPAQDMTSGLYSSYKNDANPDYEKIKAKSGLLVDFDLDGDLDLYYGYQFNYYFENIEGSFVEKTDVYDIDKQGSFGLVSSDIDNNGYPDILKWRSNDNDDHHLLLNNGNHQFSTYKYLPDNELEHLHGQGLLDFDLDGDVDIIAIEDLGDTQFHIYENLGYNSEGNMIFEESFNYDAYDGSTTKTLAIADYDNDGDQDIFLARKYGINWLFRNETISYDGFYSYNENPNPQFSMVAFTSGVTDESISTYGSMGYGAAWGDYDNDLDFDLYIGHWSLNKLYTNEQGSFYDTADQVNVQSDTLSNGMSWADYNNDGRLDLWSSNIRKQDDVYFSDDGAVFDSSYSPIFLSATQDVISGDYDQDGWIDVFAPGLIMGSPAPQGAKYTSLMYKNITSDSTNVDNNWIKVNLEGSKIGIDNLGWSNQANKSALGARVYVSTSDKVIMREVIAGKGHNNMEPLELHFGIGESVTIDQIRIIWPSREYYSNAPKETIFDGPIEPNKSYRIVEDIGMVGIKGDVNFDNSVNVIDIVAIVNEILLDPSLNQNQLWAGDMVYSGSLDILDLVSLIEFILIHT